MDHSPASARTEAEIAEAFAIADLVRRVAGDTGVHLYELEVSSPTDYVCVLWVGEALETLLGPTQEGLDPEQAWEACIPPDDLAAYHATVPELWAGRSTEVEYRLVGFNGTTRWVWQRCRPRRRVDRRVIAEGIVSDITERRHAEDALHEARERLRHLAYHDGLTGLPNRLLLAERLDARIAEAARDGAAFPLLFVDLDGFKPLNDRHGHAVGDRVLQVIAERLRAMVRWDDAIARLGGDEFLVAGPCVDTVAGARSAATVWRTASARRWPTRSWSTARRSSSPRASAPRCTRSTAGTCRRCSRRPTARCTTTSSGAVGPSTRPESVSFQFFRAGGRDGRRVAFWRLTGQHSRPRLRLHFGSF